MPTCSHTNTVYDWRNVQTMDAAIETLVCLDCMQEVKQAPYQCRFCDLFNDVCTGNTRNTCALAARN